MRSVEFEANEMIVDMEGKGELPLTETGHVIGMRAQGARRWMDEVRIEINVKIRVRRHC